MGETGAASEIIDSLTARLSRHPGLRSLGIEIVDAAPGRLRMTLVPGADNLNGRGNVHGGFLFTLADTACGFALLSQAEGGVTQSAHITYVRPAEAGDTIVIEAAEIARTRRTQTFDAKISSASGETIALFRGIFQLMPKS